MRPDPFASFIVGFRDIRHHAIFIVSKEQGIQEIYASGTAHVSQDHPINFRDGYQIRIQIHEPLPASAALDPAAAESSRSCVLMFRMQKARASLKQI